MVIEKHMMIMRGISPAFCIRWSVGTQMLRTVFEVENVCLSGYNEIAGLQIQNERNECIMNKKETVIA